jgi:hypothetical protein
MDNISGHIRLDEQDKLIVENDNATIENDVVSSKLHGNYTISSDDLKRLLVTLNGGSVVKDIYVRQYSDFDLEDYLTVCEGVLFPYDIDSICVTKDVAEIIEHLLEHIVNLNEIIMHYEKEDAATMMSNTMYKPMYEELKRRVERHNKTHLFGKIKIDESN